MCDLVLELVDFLLQLLGSLHSLLTRFSSGKGVPRSFLGHVVIELLEMNGWKRFVTASRTDADGGRKAVSGTLA